jgi:hypothetical protein
MCVVAQAIENSQHYKGMVPLPNLKHIGEIAYTMALILTLQLCI